MQAVVAVVVVVGIAAVLVRFLGGSGEGARLPRVIDESIGMWVVRGMRDRLRPPARGRSSAASRPPARARGFDAEMAGRLGIPRAGDVVPRKPIAKPAAARAPGSRAAERRLRHPVVLALFALLAIGAGVLLGAGAGLLAPR